VLESHYGILTRAVPVGGVRLSRDGRTGLGFEAVVMQ